VQVAKPEYVLAMKLFALERSTVDDRDFEDAVSLCMEVGIETAEELTALAGRYYPTTAMPLVARRRIDDIVRELNRRKGLQP